MSVLAFIWALPLGFLLATAPGVVPGYLGGSAVSVVGGVVGALIGNLLMGWKPWR